MTTTSPRTGFRTHEVVAALAGLIEGESSALVQEILHPVPNFWEIVDYGDKAGEIRYSKMIGWLLDPRESHGLGTSFAQRFVDAVYGEHAPVISDRARVHPREWRSIDVLLVDHDESGAPVTTLVIENKTDSVEHPRSGSGVAQTTWYNWVIRGDFARIRAAVDAADVEPARRRSLRRRIRRWEAETGDYRVVPDEGRYFVYLTPRPDEQAEDASFRTLSYERLDGLLAQARHELVERSRLDAEKIVRDFQRTIRRRYDASLGRAIEDLFVHRGAAPSDCLHLAPELTGLARRLGLIDEEHARSGDDEYLHAIRVPEDGVEGTLAALNRRVARPVSDIEFRHLIARLWDHRPTRSLHDTSKFHWGNARGRRLAKIELLQKIALAFAEERGIDTLEEFERQFGEIVRDVVGVSGVNPFVGGTILYDPDVHPYSVSASRRYQARDIAMRDDIGALTLGSGRYLVHWRLGCRSDREAGRLIHLPVIEHFMAHADPMRYPISRAER